MKKDYRLLIFLIKAYRPLLFIWVALMAAVYYLFIDRTPLSQDHFALLYLYIFGAVLLYPVPVILFMKNQYRKINCVLFTYCDPPAYIDIYQRVIDELAKTKRPASLDYYRLNLSAGFIAAGRYDEAYQTLGDLKSFKNNRIGRLSNVVRYNNLCSVCLKLGRADEAKYYLDCLAGSVAALSSFYREKYMKYVDLAQYGVNISKGVFDSAENFYNEVFYKAASNYERVSAQFVLGKVLLHYGDTRHAKEAFEYAVKHGNKLYIAEEAKKRLDELGAGPAGGGL